MEAKILIILLIAINCYSSCGAALRRTPKVYNALITTDENLTSSRAYPVIQPTIHESGLAHYPFGPYNPYGFYTPPLVRFGQPIVPGLAPNQQFPYPLPQQRFPPQFMHLAPPNSGPQLVPTPNAAAQQPPPQDGSPVESTPPTAPPPTEEQQPVQPPTLPPPPKNPTYMPPLEPIPPKQAPHEKLPIPLNEFGLPPSLIPLQQYPNRSPNGPVALPPYAFNQYPLIYDPITGYREQYLPPYEYFPSHHQHFALGGGPPAAPKPLVPTPPTAEASVPAPTPASLPPPPNQPPPPASDEEIAASEPQPQPEDPPQLPPAVGFDSIKNASKNKNSAVPDVPPPPIPSGAKTQQS
ncbi:PREDICTED: early nodulin-75 [Rhagoletis zephyria]|uniref:early nodulin-75 n=1 Tax=Rhagoletis zephyria TaxID=28612 RepID=UPI0008113379|nr:PREDICTED: early nodulin-75 [Rhagoletis zephyria]